MSGRPVEWRGHVTTKAASWLGSGGLVGTVPGHLVMLLCLSYAPAHGATRCPAGIRQVRRCQVVRARAQGHAAIREKSTHPCPAAAGAWFSDRVDAARAKASSFFKKKGRIDGMVTGRRPRDGAVAGKKDGDAGRH